MDNGKKETIYAFVYGSLSKVVTYLLLLVFANLYLPSDYGLGNFVLNIRNIVMFFLFLGLPDALIPLIVRKKKINSILKIINYSTFIVFLLGLIISFKEFWILPLVLTLPLVMFNTIAMAFWRAKAKYDVPNKIGFHSIILILLSAYLLKDYGKLGVVTAYAIGNLYSFFATVYPIRKEMKASFRGKFNIKETKEYFKAAIIITSIGGLFTLLLWIDSTLLGLLSSYENVASFGIASALAGVISVIPISLSMFMITRASQVLNNKKSKDILHRVVRVSFFISLFASILLVSILTWIIKIFFNKYTGIELPTSIMVIGTVFFASYYIIYSYYVGKMESSKALLPVIFGLLINIIVSIILIPQFGILGVSIAYSLTHLFILFYLARNEKMRRITLMSLFAIFAIILSYSNIYIGITIFILTPPLSLLVKIITLEDIMIIKETIFKIAHR